jgi:hypothetical protein
VNAGSGLISQARDLVLHLQLATLQLYDLHIVGRGMSKLVSNFLFECPMPRLQFRKSFHGHRIRSPRSVEPDEESLARGLWQVDCGLWCNAKNPHFPARHAWLERPPGTDDNSLDLSGYGRRAAEEGERPEKLNFSIS